MNRVEFLEKLRQALELAHSCGVSTEELVEMLRTIEEEEREDGKCD